MKYLKLILVFCAFGLFSCVDEDVPTAEGTLLDFEVPDTPPEANYTLGAHYLSFGWNPNLYETPVIGQYNAGAGDPVAYAQHVKWAQQGEINFFIFTMRSAVVESDFKTDSTFIANLMTASNAAEMNFALAYSLAQMQLNDDNRIDVEANLLGQMVNDFRRMAQFLTMANTATTSAGAKVVYIRNANALFAENYANVFETVRSTIQSEFGLELYLIAEQPEWTPPLRFEHRFADGYDAVSHRSYIQIGSEGNQSFYDRYIMFEQYTDLALSLSSEELARVNLDYIPQISPSYDGTIMNANNRNYVIEKNEEWFRTYCDIAKRASGNNPERFILVDAFNSWNDNRQLEPAESYNTQFLDILKSEFKVN